MTEDTSNEGKAIDEVLGNEILGDPIFAENKKIRDQAVRFREALLMIRENMQTRDEMVNLACEALGMKHANLVECFQCKEQFDIYQDIGVIYVRAKDEDGRYEAQPLCSADCWRVWLEKSNDS